jgi:hypothetical protein
MALWPIKIIVYPRSRGELRMPGKYSRSTDLRAKVSSPPEREVALTSDDRSIQGVRAVFAASAATNALRSSRMSGTTEITTSPW